MREGLSKAEMSEAQRGLMSWISQRRPSLKRLWSLQEGLYMSTIERVILHFKEMRHDLQNAPEGAQ